MEATARRCRSLTAALCLTALAACGGGGGGGGGSGGGGGGTASVPTITMQPTSMSVAAGGTATFTIAATGNGTLTYQWYWNVGACPNCAPISGATAPTLTVTANAVTSAEYYCVVTNTLNGTNATATSAGAHLSAVEPQGSAAITADAEDLPNSAGLVATVASQAGVTYTWTISNGTITAGQGTPQITYTSGALGPLQITATVSGPTAGTEVGVSNVVVVAALPIVSIFAQSSVLRGASGVLASTTANAGQTYAWTLENGTASATVVGSSTTDTLTYNVGSTPGSYQISVDVTDQVGNNGSAAHTLSVVQGTFLKDVRDMAQRSLHTATLLNDGRVLVAGGDAGIPDLGDAGDPNVPNVIPVAGSQSNVVATAELFDPVTSTWAVVGSLSVARSEHVAVRLDDGRVLVAGGADGTGTALASSEIYDPSTQTWSLGPSLSAARALATATLLADGRVLVSGGTNFNGILGSAEIYDPVANSWSSAGTMMNARLLHSLTRLANGQVLAAGGLPGAGGGAGNMAAEVYNPATNSWQAAASMPAGAYAEGAVLLPSGNVLQLPGMIYDPVADTWQEAAPPAPGALVLENGEFSAATAVLLPNGRVLAAGSAAGSGGGPGSAIYDPVMQAWSAVPNPPAIGSAQWPGIDTAYGTVTALQDGRVLADGGVFGFPESTANSLSNASLYDPTSNSWSVSGSQAHAGYYAASGVLGNGEVLVSGGTTIRDETTETASVSAADLFNPATNTWTAAAAMNTPRQQHTATVLLSGGMLVTGGTSPPGNISNSAELYDPTSNTWSSAGTMSTSRYQHTASLLASGMVLVAGGNDVFSPCSCTTFVNSADLYNPATNSFTPTGALVTARYAHTATVLQNGMVLVTGGFGGPTSTIESGGAVLASAELYDPTTGTWTATGSMTTTRMNHTAALLSSGMVLVAGGETGTATTATAEVYNPTSGTWTAVASMNTPRQSQGMALLADATVLIVGGLNDTSSATIGVGTAEVYDPTANAWTLTGAMVTARQFFVLNALSDGRILLDGGEPNASGLPEFYK